MTKNNNVRNQASTKKQDHQQQADTWDLSKLLRDTPETFVKTNQLL